MSQPDKDDDRPDERADGEQEHEVEEALRGLHRMSAPSDFGKEVTDTIRRRSAGRFFGRRAFGDRVPFELLAVLAIVLGLAAWLVIRSSDTGSLRYEGESEKPDIAPGAEEVVPKP